MTTIEIVLTCIIAWLLINFILLALYLLKKIPKMLKEYYKEGFQEGRNIGHQEGFNKGIAYQKKLKERLERKKHENTNFNQERGEGKP